MISVELQNQFGAHYSLSRRCHVWQDYNAIIASLVRQLYVSYPPLGSS